MMNVKKDDLEDEEEGALGFTLSTVAITVPETAPREAIGSPKYTRRQGRFGPDSTLRTFVLWMLFVFVTFCRIWAAWFGLSSFACLVKCTADVLLVEVYMIA